MRVVTNKELSSFKLLPFDIYDKDNNRVFEAGEVLTPGKLMALKKYEELFTEEYDNETITQTTPVIDKETAKKLANFTYETLDGNDFETTINKDCTIKLEVQTKIKYFCRKTFDLFENGFFEEGLSKLNDLVSILIAEAFKPFYKTPKGSQIRFLGEYEICHPLNVAILSGLIAKKMELSNIEIEDVILAGLLHDIGKYRIHIPGRSAVLTTNEDEVAHHTTLGYDIIKKELGLSDVIAKVALEHHENNDGSGYPHGLSSDYISELSQIINVANYYDNLACNRTTTHVLCNRDALRAMLEVGTKRFSAQSLYTFIHMYTYDDPKDFSDMTI